MITLITITFSSVLISLFISSTSSNFYFGPNRFTVARSLLVSFVKSLFVGLSAVFSTLLSALMLFLLVINVAGNIPIINIGSLYYFVTCSISLTL